MKNKDLTVKDYLGKENQLVEPLHNGNINWETFSDIHPLYVQWSNKASEKGQESCMHCGKGITNMKTAYNIHIKDCKCHLRGEVLPANTPERELIRNSARTFYIGPECAKNLPQTHKKKVEG
jgi:hypothetical protein